MSANSCQDMIKKEGAMRNLKGKLIEVLQWYDRSCNVAGWSRAFHSDNKLSKFIWTCLFMQGICLTILSVNKAIQRYYSYSTITTMENDFQQSIALPAIVICNSNRVHCGNLYNVINSTVQVKQSKVDSF